MENSLGQDEHKDTARQEKPRHNTTKVRRREEGGKHLRKISGKSQSKAKPRQQNRPITVRVRIGVFLRGISPLLACLHTYAHRV